MLVAAALASAVVANSYAPPGHIQTSSGIIIGHSASNKSQVTEFLGIRYAEAPVGELRFAAPKKYVAPAGTVYQAAEWVSVNTDKQRIRAYASSPVCRLSVQ